ncbi:MAG TPA: carbohydrate ABC transporter permease, partial [Arthrobacter sp.]
MSILNKSAAPNDENNDDGARRPAGLPGSRGNQPGKVSQVEKRKNLGLGSFALLALGAFVFLFPFYYMFIGSLQTSPDTSVAGAFPNPANVTGENYTNINNSINLLQGLANSGIFTGGV